MYLEIKTINGNDYAYLRKSIRKGDRVTHKNVKYLGRADKLSTEILNRHTQKR